MLYAEKTNKELKKEQRMKEVLASLPDSLLEEVEVKDLLDDEVYLQLAHEGWSAREIESVMNQALKNKGLARAKWGYGAFAKNWRPAYGRNLSDDSLYSFTDTAYMRKMVASVSETVPLNDLNHTWPKEIYNPDDRKNGRRNPGYFRTVHHNPSSGRIRHIAVHPSIDRPDSLYVIADGSGIFKTGDAGLHWTCITDNVPDRMNRSECNGYSIPVDPDNWNHLFAFMSNNSVYETFDGGESWQRVPGATYKNFKKGYAFRDEEGNLKFIGGEPNGGNYMLSKLWISEDKGVSWTEVTIPDNLKEKTVEGTGLWFQQVYFNPKERNKIFLPGSRSILYFDDGAKKGSNGMYNLKKLEFNIIDENGKVLKERLKEFPFEGDAPGMMDIDPNNPNKMWYAMGIRSKCQTALYATEDGGMNWKVLHNDVDSIGKGHMFGNETPGGWLGGFGVNYNNPDKMYGCSMSSAKSSDGGRTWTEYAWGNRLKSRIRDAGENYSDNYYYVTNSRHNADNHTIVAHASGRVYRASDSGILMIDPEINGGEWTNIGGDMGQMLYYNVRVNEFGDQAIVGNTQDIDVQTYRYGRWGHWRGYEGSEASFNPYSGAAYFSGGGGGDLEGMSFSSWHTARNFADVTSGSWYMLRTWSGNVTPSTLYRIDDVGRSVVDLYPGIGKRVVGFSITRDGETPVIYVNTADWYFYKSTDRGESFQMMKVGSVDAKFSNTRFCVDPNDSRYIYLGQNGGKVLRWDTQTGTYQTWGTGLPSINCDRLLFHEGSGDIYFVSYSNGIYLLENGSSTWRYWVKGYNPSKFNDCDINYTTQELTLSDYGRGVWIADLENPADRYFKTGFKLKEYSNVNGRRTIGIDTKWTIPLYYNYEWTVTRGGNRQDISNPYQYLNYALEPGDVVELKLSLRESPDVTTVSAPFTVQATESAAIEHRQGNAMYSDGSGRMDIGYMDWFFDDFTVDLWVNPESDGVILANRQREADPDRKGAKGWMLYVEGGKLKFAYSPRNYFQQPTYETSETQTKIIEGGAIAMNSWSHVAVTQVPSGEIKLYVNGNQTASEKRLYSDHTLNNSVGLSLFGDIYEHNTLKGAVDEIKVWSRALSQDEVRREMFSTNLPNADGLVVHYGFNGETPDDDPETFAGHQPLPRTRARPEYRRQTVPVSADYQSSGGLGNGKHTFADGHTKLIDITVNVPSAEGNAIAEGDDKEGPSGETVVNGQVYVYGYKTERWNNEDDNLDRKYYEPTSTGYLIRTYGDISPDATADIAFHNGEGSFDSDHLYRLYAADNAGDRTYWKLYDGKLELSYEGTLLLAGAPLQSLAGKKLLIVAMQPAFEMEIAGLNAQGQLEVFSEDADRYSFTIRPVAKKDTPGEYSILSSSDVIATPSAPVTFREGIATGALRVDMDSIGGFGKVIPVSLKGEDDRMIPLPVDVVNHITDKELGNGVSISKGGLIVGNAADFSPLYGSNTMTMMAWVKIDAPEVLTSGRNGDGCAPLLFFRNGSGPNGLGLHLQRRGKDSSSADYKRSMLTLHWNDRNIGNSISTNLTVTTDDVGKWFHVALKVYPEGYDLFLNGMKYTIINSNVGNKVSGANIITPLMLGMNVDTNTWFSGSFDNVAVWNRSLDDEEIRKYMHERVLLNDDALLSYVTMDYTDANNGKLIDQKTGHTLKEVGTVTKNCLSTAPFNPDSREKAGKDKIISFSDGLRAGVNVFDGTPYRYLSEELSGQYYPLNREYYTVVNEAYRSSEADKEVKLTYNHKSILQKDRVIVGIRQLGDPNPMNRFYDAVADAAGTVDFTIPAVNFDSSVEMIMLLPLTEDATRRPLIVDFANRDMLDGKLLEINTSNDLHYEIPIEVESFNINDELIFEVVESHYASLENSRVTLDDNTVDKNNRVNLSLKIARDKIKAFDINPVTINVYTNVAGASIKPLSFSVYLKPRVKLSLLNGTDATHFTATNPYPTLDVKAELEYGYLTEDVNLKFSPEGQGMSLDAANGKLFSQNPVTMEGLKYDMQGAGAEKNEMGWNLVGNPYMSNVNLTKHQNVDYDETKLTRFLYNTIPGTDNLVAYDMTEYDASHAVAPFQAFFVQAMAQDAAISVTPTARETGATKKTFDYYAAEEVATLRMSLMQDGREMDRAVIKWSQTGRSEYALNEDAPKIMSRNEATPCIYTMPKPVNSDPGSLDGPALKTSSLLPLSINEVGIADHDVDLYVKGGSGDKLTLVPTERIGLNPEYTLYLSDNRGSTQELELGKEYELDPGRRYVITYNYQVGVEKIEDDRTDYRIYTEPGRCIVAGLQGKADISVYSVGGMMMGRAATSLPTYTFELQPDVYIVRILENGREFTSKILVK